MKTTTRQKWPHHQTQSSTQAPWLSTPSYLLCFVNLSCSITIIPLLPMPLSQHPSNLTSVYLMPASSTYFCYQLASSYTILIHSLHVQIISILSDLFYFLAPFLWTTSFPTLSIRDTPTQFSNTSSEDTRTCHVAWGVQNSANVCPCACCKRRLIMGYKLSYTTGSLYAWSSCMQ